MTKHQTQAALFAMVIATIALAAAPASAVVKQGTFSNETGLQVATGKSPRQSRHVDRDRVPVRAARAWTTFSADVGNWRSMWDSTTGVPLRLYGKGIHVSGSVANASAAATHARAFLARHIGLLAPGANSSDFVLVSNELHNGMRTVGFEQRWNGMRVVGGQVGFQYKNDRMFVVSSEALPYVSARSAPLATLGRLRAINVAEGWLKQDAASIAHGYGNLSTPVVLPIITDSSVRYVTAVKTTVDARAPYGEWTVYLDAHTGSAVAREQTLRFATGNILFNTPERRPTDTRANYPARDLVVSVGGSAGSTDIAGLLAWANDQTVSVTLGVSGPLVAVTNEAGDPASAVFNLDPEEILVWDARANELVDSQLTAFIHTRIAKEYARAFNPGLGWLDEQMPVIVNIDDSCNAFSNGNAINFFQSSDKCDNTALLPDVIYHEFGHSLHNNSIIEGVGAFDGAFSEGLSDYLASTITGDSAMGRGFFYTEEPLREIDPLFNEHRWPDDIGEIHFTGLIFAGAMWDLRKTLIATHGEEAGVTLADQLFYAAVQSAADIPSTYVAILAADDDDGDLANGTPNVCDINATFGVHGLRSLPAEIVGLGSELPNVQGHLAGLRLSGLFDQCPGDQVTDAQLVWKLRGDDDITQVPLNAIADNEFEGYIPTTDSQTILYRFDVEFADGSTRSFPSNVADPFYEFYVGETVELYCTDFESDPFADGWTHGLAAGDDSEGADDWQWGVPVSIAGSGDPGLAYSGDYVIGNDLGGTDFNGTYQPDKTNYASSPVINTENFSDVRLQFRRWLNVEDGFFDQATIYANNRPTWQNLNSDNGNSSTTHHRDGEWRFQDVSLSNFITDGTVQVKFEISSDGGLEMGGWTIDDLCIVASANSICGDGEITGSEDCDDGADNSDSIANACRSNCQAAVCGDGVVDTGEQCDNPSDIDQVSCSRVCQVVHDRDCGLTVAGRNYRQHTGISVLGVMMLLGLLWRRRRASRSSL